MRYQLPYEHVRNVFAENGCVLLATEYKNGHEKMPYICSCGRQSVISLNKLRAGRRCMECGKQRTGDAQRRTLEEVQQAFKEQGCTLIEPIYVGAHQLMRYLCSCGRAAKISFSNFQTGRRCKQCKIEKLSGENHPSYNPNLTEEERIIGRNYLTYREWRVAVYERDGFACRNCGQANHQLNAHHIENYATNKHLRTELSNGITLCQSCHQMFHKQYGTKDNNRTQLEAFLGRPVF